MRAARDPRWMASVAMISEPWYMLSLDVARKKYTGVGVVLLQNVTYGNGAIFAVRESPNEAISGEPH